MAGNNPDCACRRVLGIVRIEAFSRYFPCGPTWAPSMNGKLATLGVAMAGMLIVCGIVAMMIPSWGECTLPDPDRVSARNWPNVVRFWEICEQYKADRAWRATCDSRSWFGLVGEDRCPAEKTP